MTMLILTDHTRCAVVDQDGKVRGDTSATVLTYDDAELRHELADFGSGTLTLWLLPEKQHMSLADIFALPRSVPDLVAHGATAYRTITM